MSSGRRTSDQRLYILLSVICAGVLGYSQATILDWDEGFHLIAASMMMAGKRPYIDFCFPQPWLHVVWNASWVRLSSGWRGPHLAAALLSCGAIVLTAVFVRRRVDVERWGVMPAIIAALIVGLNSEVVTFGTKAQAYGACMFLTFAAYCTAIARAAWFRSAAAGCLAGIAAGCSLLAAPAAIVLLLWTFRHRGWRHALAMISGILVASIPLIVSLAEAPYQTWFNLVAYHVLYRRASWTGATKHDVLVVLMWAGSGQALVLVILAAFGFRYVRGSAWDAARKAEFYLAAWLAAGLGIEAAVAHPTFPQYFVLAVPFVAILAAPGFCDLTSRISVRPRLSVAALACVLLSNLGKSLIEMHDGNETWADMQSVASKIRQVTPDRASILADPPVYFALRLLPPSGMEFPASHALEMPAPQAAVLHIVPQSVLEKRVRAGEFATVQTCRGDEDEVKALGLPRLYSRSFTIADCQVYWNFKRGID